MGLFSPPKTKDVEGVIERIGAAYAGEWSLDYVFTLQGSRHIYRAHLRESGNEPIGVPVALAKPGDRVTFTVKEKTPRQVYRKFVNHDL